MPGHGRSNREDRGRLARLASGDRAALAEIYDRHAEGLFGQALWLLRNRQDAEDVVQTVMVKLAEMGPDLLGIRRLKPYLLSMAHRESLDLARRRRSRPEEPLEGLLIAAGAADPEERVETSRLLERLAGLDPSQREAVYLHLYMGLTFREIGRVTGVSLFTAASRYRLAIARLRREIGR